MKLIITISKIAKGHLINLLKNSNTKEALFAVKGGGCNGLKYILEAINKPEQLEKTDIVPIDQVDNINYNLHVCQKSQFYLLGTEIDWKDNFMGQHFSFSNPNQAASCGCGSTFSV